MKQSAVTAGNWRSSVKVGELVRWSAHEKWDHGGLGTIVEAKYDGARVGRKYRIMWHVDIEDIVGYKGVWYSTEDFKLGSIVEV
jgi:hypothetical protein